MMQRKILALLLCGVLLLGVLAGCGKKDTANDPSGTKTTGTETKNETDTALSAKYVYQAEYLELPVKTNYIDKSVVSGNTLFFYAQVQDESYATARGDMPDYTPTVGKLLTYDLDTQTVGETDYAASSGENSSTNVMALCAAADASGECASVFYVMETLPGADSVTQELTDQMTAAGWRTEVISAYQTAGGAPYLDYTDTVFGQVYEGMDVVDAIARTGVDEAQRPTESITINSVTITKYE